MFSFLKLFNKEDKNVFTIGNSDEGFFIADRYGAKVEDTGFYTRARDARRGAARRGLTLA